MKYFIWGYYGFGNLGDELMLKNIVRKIHDRDNEAMIYVRCYNTPNVPGIIPFSIEKTRLPFPFSTISYFFRIFRLIIQIDTIIIGGGTLFLDKGRHNFSMLIIAMVTSFAKLIGKRIYIVGVGMDILTCPLNIMYLKNILKKSNAVVLRDDFSYTMAKYLSPEAKIFRAADILFDKFFVSSLTHDYQCNKKYIVISLSDYYKSVYPIEEKRHRLKEASCELLTMLMNKYSNDYSIVLCAFQKSIGERDYEYLDEIKNVLAQKKSQDAQKIEIRYIENEDQIREVFGSAVFTIGMRYHALVLSSIFKKPFLGIDIEMKIKEFCVEFNMPFINIDTFLAENINPSDIENLLSREISDKKITQQMNLSKANFEWLNNLK